MPTTMQVLAFRLGYLPTVAEEALQVFQVHAGSPLLAGLHVEECHGKARTATEVLGTPEKPLLSFTASRRMCFLLASTLPGLSTSASPYPGTPIHADNLGIQWHIHTVICCVGTPGTCQVGLPAVCTGRCEGSVP